MMMKVLLLLMTGTLMSYRRPQMSCQQRPAARYCVSVCVTAARYCVSIYNVMSERHDTVIHSQQGTVCLCVCVCVDVGVSSEV